MVLIPDGVDAAHPAPAVAVWHQHNGKWHLGKTEPAGLAGNPMHHTGVALVREGVQRIAAAYQAAGAPEMWRRTRDWLAKHLKSGAAI